jgi:hypothetical protein
MYRRVLITGVTAAAIVGAGTTALAVTGTDTTSGTPTNTSSPKDHAKKADKHNAGKDKAGKDKAGKGKLLKRAAHAQIVTKGKNGFVTHNLITGTVTSVSATSITVQAADKKSETFTVAKDTKVRARADGKASASTISKVVKGDRVLVAGTGTSTLTAKHVIDLGKK